MIYRISNDMNHFQDLLFYIFSFLAIASSLTVVASRRPSYGVLAVAGGIISLAGIFILLEAYFVAVIQVLIYAGAVLVLFLFVIMTLGIDVTLTSLKHSRFRLGTSLLLCLAFFAQVVFLMRKMGTGLPLAAGTQGSTEALGRLLFSEYLLPFELLSGVLLIGILGIVILTQKESKNMQTK